jgi:class 3 adenylate cyclase
MEHKEYRLAAIMFTDIHGFSAMMEKDEEKTLTLLTFHNELIRRLVAEHSGTIIKTIGDAFLADFRTTVDAVRCAVKVQDELRAYNGTHESDPLLLRIGVHLGDIHFYEDDAIGEGINIASRLQSLAKPGRICISKEVYDQVAGKLNLNYMSIGRAKLKNISREIYAFEIVPEGETAAVRDERGEGTQPESGVSRERDNVGQSDTRSGASDMDEIKDFIMNQVKKVSRRISVNRIKEIFPAESPDIDGLLEKLVKRGYLTRLEKDDGEVAYGADETHAWNGDLDLPLRVRERINRKVMRKKSRYARKYARKYGGEEDWDYEGGKSLSKMSWDEYVSRVETKAERAGAGFFGHLTTFLIVNAGLFILNLLTSWSLHPWFLYPLGGWGIGLVCNFVDMRNRQRQKREVSKLPALSKDAMITYNKLRNAKSELSNHLAAFVSVNGFLLMINYITSWAVHPWFLYPLVAWGFGLLVHMSVAIPTIASLRRKLKELIGKAGAVFTGKKKKEYQEEDEIVREALSIRDSIIAEIDASGKKASPLDADMKPLLIKYVDQVRDLNSKHREIEELIRSIPMGDLEVDLAILRDKAGKTQSSYMKQEYEKSIQEIERHKHSFEELNNQKELVGLRLKSSMNNLKQLQIDLARMKSMSISGDEASVSLIKDKTRELSQYLDDLRAGYKELSDSGF